MKILLTVFCLCLAFIVSCNNDTVNTEQNISYKLITSVAVNDFSINLYITGYDSLTTGYNVFYFKVKKNSVNQTNGCIKFFPKMWMTPTYAHSTPYDSTYNFDFSIGYYTGYTIFSMPTGPTTPWWGFISYVDELGISFNADSVSLDVSYYSEKQWRFIYDSTDESTYMLTLLKPFTAQTGLNDFNIMLHKSDAYLYEHMEISNAEIILNTYNQDTSSFPSGNVNPLPGSDAVYRGKINLPFRDKWFVEDTIRINGRIITNNPPPMPSFYFDIR